MSSVGIILAPIWPSQETKDTNTHLMLEYMLKLNRTIEKGANNDDDGANSTRTVKSIERETGNEWISCIGDDGIVHGRCTHILTNVEIAIDDIRSGGAPER